MENNIIEELQIDEIEIPVTPGQILRSGVKTVTGSISAEILAPTFVIPYHDARKKTGYQRKPQESRINKLMSQMRRQRVDVPTSILLNIREIPKHGLVQKKDGAGGGLFLKFKITENLKFHVVDGQHRVLALVSLYGEDPDRWADFNLQFVLMLGADENQEMDQFYVVNSTAKSVRTDLALDLLKQRAETDDRIWQETIETGQQWKIEAQTIVEKLNQESSVWKRKIRLANEEKGDTTITSSSFVASLKPLLKSPYFQALTLEKKVKILDAFWQGVRSACREPFDQDSNSYSIQKGIGVNVLHEILVLVIEHVRSKGDSPSEPDSYHGIMKKVLDKLEGDNFEGIPVSGSDFWLTAPLGGAAGSYSSSAGKRVLIAKLKQLLPELEVE